MGQADYFLPGSWNIRCQECAEKWKAIHIRKRWDGLYVCPFCFENRPAQDFLKGVPDKQQVPFSTGNTPSIYPGTVGSFFTSPTTGFAFTVPANVETVFIDPVSQLATGTVTMPAAPPQLQFVRLYSTQNITAITILPNAGQTISNNPPNLVATEPVLYQYSGTAWARQKYA